MSEFLDFVPIARKTKTAKTDRWAVRSKQHGDTLGVIEWHSPWRRYVFKPEDGTLFDGMCCAAINDFLVAQMKLRKWSPPCTSSCTDIETCKSATKYSSCDDCRERCPMQEGAMCQGCGCYEDCCDCDTFEP